MSGRILVAGIGNVFLGDDGFGVEVARRLAARPLPEGVRVVDYGIRGLDLAFSLLDNYDAVIFLDAARRGEPPRTLYLIEAETRDEGIATVDSHGMDPVKVLAFARSLGAQPATTFVVACEPETLVSEDSPEVLVELSSTVRAAVDEAVTMVTSLIDALMCAGRAVAVE